MTLSAFKDISSLLYNLVTSKSIPHLEKSLSSNLKSNLNRSMQVFYN